MKRHLTFSLLASLVALPMSVWAESSPSAPSSNWHNHYDYLGAYLSAGSMDQSDADSKVTDLTVAGRWAVGEHWFTQLDYSARFLHPDDITTNLYTLLPGVGYRIAASDKLDLFAMGKFGYLWASQTDDATDDKFYSDHGGVWGASIGAQYALSTHWKLEGQAQLTRSNIVDEQSYSISAHYRVSQRFVLGGFYTYRDSDYDTASQAGSAQTNEAGVSLRFLL